MNNEIKAWLRDAYMNLVVLDAQIGFMSGIDGEDKVLAASLCDNYRKQRDFIERGIKIVEDLP